MRLRRSYGIFAAVLGAVVAHLACDNDVRYEVVYDCTKDETLYRECAGGASYTCVGASLPGDSDPTLICSSGHSQSSGTTEFCCNGTSASTCEVVKPDAEVPVVCLQDETRYECGGQDTPAQHDSSLHCNAGGAGDNGQTVYCCTHDGGAPGSTCAQEEDAGCAFGSTGYDCPSGLVPTTQDPALRCDSARLQSNGDNVYCCDVPDAG
ncbi:MAG TPA: hypothetical protein VF407_05445 [Polyangiaceae bacterium]